LSNRTTRSRPRPESPAVQTDSSRLLPPTQGFLSTSAVADETEDAVGDPLEPRPKSVSILSRQGSDDGEDELDLLRKSPPARAASYPRAYSVYSDEQMALELAPGSAEASGIEDLSLPTERGFLAEGQIAAVAVSSEREEAGKGEHEAAKPPKLGTAEATSEMDVDKPPVNTVNPQDLIFERPTEVSDDVVMLDEPHHLQADKLQQSESKALSITHNIVQVPPMSSHGHHEFLPTLATPAKRPIIVLSTQSSKVPERDYVFSELPSTTSQPTSSASTTPLQRRLQFKPTFTVPPLKAINPEYTRKSKSLKRKRDKEREGGGSRKENCKDESVPLGLNKWAATLNANPVWKKVSRAPKCLSTREWAVCPSIVT